MSFEDNDLKSKKLDPKKTTESNNKKNNAADELSLERMEALLTQSAQGIHVLFENKDLVSALKQVESKENPKAEQGLEHMQKVQEAMTQLIAKRTYFEKMAYLQSLDSETHQVLLKAYFQIVENTVRANQAHQH